MPAEKTPGDKTYEKVMITGKTVIIHRVRKFLDLTNREYVFMDFLQKWYSHKQDNFLTKGDVFIATAIKLKNEMFHPLVNPLIQRLKSKGMLKQEMFTPKDGSPELVVMVSDKWLNAFKKKAIKKIIDKAEIPTEEVFMDFCKTIPDMPHTYEALEYALRAKYEAWKDNEWKDGHNKEIKNWKSKIKNTIPFLKPDWNKINKDKNNGSAEIIEEW